MNNYCVSVSQGAAYIFLFLVSLLTFVFPEYRVHSSYVGASALSFSMAVRRDLLILRCLQVFGHGSGHIIHIICPEMKEELVCISLDCQNFCNSPKERSFQM